MSSFLLGILGGGGPGVWVRVSGAVSSLLVFECFCCVLGALVVTLFFRLSAPFGVYIKWSFRYYSLVCFMVISILYPIICVRVDF